MALENADLENDMFYADGPLVLRRGLVQARQTDNRLTGTEVAGQDICTCNPDVEGAPEQIATALNRMPKAERMLIEIAGAIRSADDNAMMILADEIEEFIVNG